MEILDGEVRYMGGLIPGVLWQYQFTRLKGEVSELQYVGNGEGSIICRYVRVFLQNLFYLWNVFGITIKHINILLYYFQDSWKAVGLSNGTECSDVVSGMQFNARFLCGDVLFCLLYSSCLGERNCIFIHKTCC